MQRAGRFALGLGAVNVLSLILIAAVSAQEGGWPVGEAAMPPGALPVSEVARRLEGHGLTHIQRIEADGKTYRVRAVNDGGQRVELRVDPVSGDVVP